jgi:hypothetical protein
MEEVKSLFSRFISLNKDKKPYIFTVCVSDEIAIDHPNSYCLWANGNTIVDFESTGFSYADPYVNPDGWELVERYQRIPPFKWALSAKYSQDEWSNKAFTSHDFLKSDSIISHYVIVENKDEFASEVCMFTEEFMKFRTDFFNCLIKCLKQLRDEKFFDSVYPERILINFEVREYYNNDDMIRIFEVLNTREEAELYARECLGVDNSN